MKIPGFGELWSLATAWLKRYRESGQDELRFHLVEASGRILPEVTDRPGRWVVRPSNAAARASISTPR